MPIIPYPFLSTPIEKTDSATEPIQTGHVKDCLAFDEVVAYSPTSLKFFLEATWSHLLNWLTKASGVVYSWKSVAELLIWAPVSPVSARIIMSGYLAMIAS